MERSNSLAHWNYRLILAGVVLANACGLALFLGAEPEVPPVSRFAPVKDLQSQVVFYANRIHESLASEQEYDKDKQSRVRNDANTLAALALMLGMHDEENPAKRTAAELIAAANQLAESSDQYKDAVAVFDKLTALVQGNGREANAPVRWEKVASLGALMKQVPQVHAPLKRSVESRFKRQADQIAGQAATLAAIAQAAMADTESVSGPTELEQWRQFCAEMRDAAGQINSAAHAGDEAAARAAVNRLSKSCDTCHDVFRKEK